MEKTASLQRANQQQRLVEWSRRVEALLGFTQNSPKETGRNSQIRIKRKSHYSKPFKSFILNSDQTTQ